MRKLSQKELLDEGIGSMLKAVGKKAAQGAAAVGGAIKTASDQGVQASWTGVGKGAVGGWKKAGDILTGKRKKLEKYLDDAGIMVQPGTKIRGKPKLAVIDVVQYDYNKETQDKEPMEDAKVEVRKFKFKDGNWETVRDKQRRSHDYGVELDKEDIAAADKNHPLTGRIVKHQTNKGNLAYGTVIGVIDEYAGIQPFKGNKAPGTYGKPVDGVEESTEEEAVKFYSGGTITASYSQKDLLRQLTLLSD